MLNNAQDINKIKKQNLKSEIQSVIGFKKCGLTEGEAEAVVYQRYCEVRICFDEQNYKFCLDIFKDSELIFSKSCSAGNRQGVMQGIWKFINPQDTVPWVEIIKGKAWSSEDIILEHLFWLKLQSPEITQARKLLLWKPESNLLH